jgi:hypothetical protein
VQGKTLHYLHRRDIAPATNQGKYIMNHKINITKSRAGHYTVTVRDPQGFRVYIRDMVSTLQMARRYAFEYMDSVNATRA